ncbi:MAG: undecaprenyldiphospho-muramoylpentapeptide beta-N-acetylglucosaminyltransferase [Candidatus Saccharimonadales bacterium]
MRIVLSGGGTGGHITPLLATAQAIKQLSKTAKLYYVGQNQALRLYPEAQKVFQGEYTIQSGKLRRYKDDEWWHHFTDMDRLFKNIVDIGKLKLGYFQSLYYLKKLKPDVVFIKGGYVGLPVGLAAATLNIPLIVHESDAKLGLTNKILSRFAKKVAVSFPVEIFNNDIPEEKLEYTGNPVRQEFFTKNSKPKAKLGLKNNKPVLLIVGGSGGAKNLNEAVLKNLDLLTAQFQVVHATGKKDYERVQQMASYISHKEASYHPYDFIKNISDYYQAADIVLCRGGMNSLAEIAASRLPAIVVPAPHLSDQVENAAYLAKRQAALVAEEATLSENLPKLLNEVVQKSTQNRLKEEISKLAEPKAAEKLAKIIIQTPANE